MNIKNILNNNSKKWDEIPTWLLVEMAVAQAKNGNIAITDGDNQRLANWQIDGTGESQARATALRILTVG